MTPQTMNAPSIHRFGAVALKKALSGAREIYVSGCSAEVPDLPGLMGPETAGSTVTGIFSPIMNRLSFADAELRRRCRTFFLNDALRRDLAVGLVDFHPWTYTGIAGWLNAPKRFDTAIVTVSPPDENNICSLGTQYDFLPEFHARVPRLIGVINPAMPRTCGRVGLPLDRFSALLEIEGPLPEFLPSLSQNDPINEAIARNVAELVPDGATVQMGIGRVSQAVAAALVGHRHLKVHSGLVDDNILMLENAGALDLDTPIVTGVAMGTRSLYDLVDRNPRFSFRSAGQTHAIAEIARNPRFIAVNSALQVDLFGQINSEGSDGRVLAGPGGLPEFLRGAQQSEGGLTIFALRAQPGRRGEGGIVARIGEPGLITVPRQDIDMVVTENGIADLRGCSLDQRAEALIAIAAPSTQAILTERWATIRQAAFA